jgi:hypothetical protein
MMTMTDVTVEDKTVEELERQLRNAKSAVNYHKNKNKNKPKKAKKQESPQARAKRLAYNQAFNDHKKAMAHVVACITANDADYASVFTESCRMPVDELRELVKEHEADVAKHIKVLQEERKVRHAKLAEQKQNSAAPTLAPTIKPIPKPVLIRPPQKTISSESQKLRAAPPSLNDVDKAQLEKVRQVVSKRLEIDLTTAQAVSHVLAKYLKNYT